MPAVTDTALAPFETRTYQAEAGAVRVLALPTPVDRVVSFAGSFLTLPDFAAGEEVVQKLVTMALDGGTRQHDRFEIAEALERRGVQLRFYADGLRCGFSGRCLDEDLGDVLALVAEQLREPLFDAEEVQKAQARHAASLRRSMEDTGVLAAGALCRRLYAPSHPNYRSELEADLRRLQALTPEAVRAYHAAHFGARDGVIALVGALDPQAATEAVRRHFGDWTAPTAAGPYTTEPDPEPPGRVEISVPDKQNLDVRMGHPVALRRDSEDYLALYVGNFIFGGNFSARLMTTVRDEQGLTYGIGAGLAGVTVEHGGHWKITVTLSGENLERGIEATLEQARRLVADGVTADELAEKQTTLTGTFKVGLATTGGLATALLANAERHFDVGYLDRFPRLIEALTVDEVNAAIRRYLDADALHVAVAGTLPEGR